MRMYVSGRMTGKSNIHRDYREGEWLWQKCWEAERENGHKLCDDCYERFKCWTSRPRSIFSDDDLYHQRLSLENTAQMMTVDEASEAFSKLSYQICEAMTKKFEEAAICFGTDGLNENK